MRKRLLFSALVIGFALTACGKSEGPGEVLVKAQKAESSDAKLQFMSQRCRAEYPEKKKEAEAKLAASGGVSVDVLVKAMETAFNKTNDYQVTKVDIEGDKAVVSERITGPSLETVLRANFVLSDEMSKGESDPDVLAKILNEKHVEYKPRTMHATMHLVKEGGAWKVDDCF